MELCIESVFGVCIFTYFCVFSSVWGRLPHEVVCRISVFIALIHPIQWTIC